MLEAMTRRDLLLRAGPALAAVGALAAMSPLSAAAAEGAAGAGGPIATALAAAAAADAYTLPPLPYAYDALEPHIDAETMRLHHDKHHQAYVTGLNKALADLAALGAAGGAGNPALLTGLQEDLTFNAGGHLLHSVFWAAMAPAAGGEPGGTLAEALAKDFSSVAAFRTQFTRVALAVKGSGWAVLAYEPVGRRLLIVQVKQHDLQLVPGAVPLLPLDVWEHAYYLKYHNVRADYIKAWWNLVNWPAVDQALAAARRA